MGIYGRIVSQDWPIRVHVILATNTSHIINSFNVLSATFTSVDFLIFAASILANTIKIFLEGTAIKIEKPLPL